jgi:hypothetical protein
MILVLIVLFLPTLELIIASKDTTKEAIIKKAKQKHQKTANRGLSRPYLPKYYLK